LPAERFRRKLFPELYLTERGGRMKNFKASETLGIENPEKILHQVREWSSKLSKDDHIIKSVVQEIHQNCEIRLDRILNLLLTYCIPMGSGDDEILKTEEDIWDQIGKMNFMQKYIILKPILKNWQDARPEISYLGEINEIRRRCTHLKDMDKIIYRGYNIFSEHEGIARLYLDAWGANKGLDDLWEWIDGQHHRLEKNFKEK
jgi:hypothetical protein